MAAVSVRPGADADADTQVAAGGTEVPTAERSGGRGAGRVALLVAGSIAALLAFALLVGGCAIVAVDRTQRDDDGFLMSPTENFSTPSYAIVSESADVDLDGAERVVKRFLGTVRIRSESGRRVFVHRPRG